MLGFFFSQVIVGFFALSQVVIRAPMTLIGSNVSSVFTQRAQELSTDISLLKTKSFQMSSMMFLVGLVPAGILFIFAPILFGWFFGERWEMAGRFTQVMSIYLLLQFAFTPLAVLFRILERQRLYSFWEWSRFLLCFIAIAIGGSFFGPLGTVCLFSLAMVLSYIMLASLSLFILNAPYCYRHA
jgi:O-antigen/teichoic acid export membrane protein